MATNSKPCPECGHVNAMPAVGTKKITCGGCGMIIVLAKVYGENWAAAAPAATPGRPKIVTRRGKAGTTEPEPAPAKEEAKPRGGRGTKGKAPVHRPHGHGHGHAHGHGHGHAHGHGHGHGPEGEHHFHYHSRKGIHPGLLWGSIGAILVAGLLSFFVYKNHLQEKEHEAEMAKLAAGKEAPKRKDEDGLAIPDVADLGDGLEIPTPSDTPADEKPAASSDKPAKASKPKRESTISANLTPFDLTEIDSGALSEIEGAITILKDLEATTAIRGADNTLFSHRKEAIPVLLNALFELKLDDRDDVKRGWSLVQSLCRCAEYKTTWENEFNVMTWPESEDDVAKATKHRTTMLKMWHKWWTDNGAGWEPPVDDESFFDD
ncbi:MAG: hypothetical protein H6807_14590 [Planctomycetes bacterium]|nr:hypothetical protein [Planctomycetota bacterium]